MPIGSASFDSAGPSAASLRAALEVVRSEAARGPATAATLVRVGELLTVLMDDGFGASDVYTAGHHLIALEDGSGHDHLGSDPPMRP